VGGVVAWSPRYLDRAVIVGSRTFGKGSVQEPVRLASATDPDVAVNADRPPWEAERRALPATLSTKDRG
jgi:carboxyl-terminal processing protease